MIKDEKEMSSFSLAILSVGHRVMNYPLFVLKSWGHLANTRASVGSIGNECAVGSEQNLFFTTLHHSHTLRLSPL